MMSELEKLQAGLEYDFSDPEVAARKARAAQLCQEFNAVPATDPTAQEKKSARSWGRRGLTCQFSHALTAIMV
ncbi:UNVERIFIED_CONTAM: hypothetical protein DV033_03660 [Limosilactobacillus fermentum]|nr:hypothetical protein [Limosilactobacillus fermentum]